MKRRQFIKAAAANVGAAVTPSIAGCNAAKRSHLVGPQSVQSLPSSDSRTWVGESFWANRLQDWRMGNGRIGCLRNEQALNDRTVSLLTCFLENENKPGRIRVRVGLAEQGGRLCGFLLGAGQGDLDYRGVALVHSCGGTGSGFMAVFDDNGELSFRDFSAQDKPLAFERIARNADPATDGQYASWPYLHRFDA